MARTKRSAIKTTRKLKGLGSMCIEKHDKVVLAEVKFEKMEALVFRRKGPNEKIFNDIMAGKRREQQQCENCINSQNEKPKEPKEPKMRYETKVRHKGKG
jgi:hypothetical protein